MKLRIAALFAMVLLLCGCGHRTAATSPTEPTASNISILAASARTDFGVFTAAAPEPADAAAAGTLVRRVLALYPDHFTDQWGKVEILLVDNLTGGAHFSHGSYAGFTQPIEDSWQMVLDVSACTAGTIHHEIAHILDGILTRSGALTEAEWMAFCPGGFSYGEGDFDRYPDFFTDAYAMENMKEDRARTFEEAILYGAGVYSDRPALWLKLKYFSRAIRNHFDTALWPEKTIWELALTP